MIPTGMEAWKVLAFCLIVKDFVRSQSNVKRKQCVTCTTMDWNAQRGGTTDGGMIALTKSELSVPEFVLYVRSQYPPFASIVYI